MKRPTPRELDLAYTVAKRLLRLHASAVERMSIDSGAEGLTWYPRERRALEALAARFDLPGLTVVACAAALSPATSWTVLMRDLPEFLRACLESSRGVPAFATYRLNRVKAARIVRERLGVEAVTGPKVRPFAEALAGDASAVVVDRHVMRYSLDRGGVKLGAVERRAIQAAHRSVAAEVGCAPRDLQSLLWVARVGYGGDPGGARAKAGG